MPEPWPRPTRVRLGHEPLAGRTAPSLSTAPPAEATLPPTGAVALGLDVLTAVLRLGAALPAGFGAVVLFFLLAAGFALDFALPDALEVFFACAMISLYRVALRGCDMLRKFLWRSCRAGPRRARSS